MAAQSKQDDMRRNSQSNKLLVLVSIFIIIVLGQLIRYENQAAAVKLYWPLIIIILKLLLPVTISIYGVTKRSLDIKGGTLALIVGVIHSFANCSFSYSLIAFFIFGSRLSKWKMKTKQTFEPVEDSGITRNWTQVFCNGIVSSIASLVYYLYYTDYNTYTSLVVLTSIACCCGDTFASEFGSVVTTKPRLITTLRHVPRGTNGGVSLWGTLASIFGGLLIGLVYYMTQQWTLSGELSMTLIIMTSTLGGLLGSLLDSLLGATLQYSGYNTKTGRISHSPNFDKDARHVSGINILTNNQVNLLSSFLTGIILPYILLNV